MVQVFKYTTKNLVCFYIDYKYEIYDSNTNKLIAIYENKNNIKLSPEIPDDPTKYKYFDEIKEIITTIENFS